MANNKTQSNKFTRLKLHDVFGYDELTRCSLETQLRRRGGGDVEILWQEWWIHYKWCFAFASAVAVYRCHRRY